MGLKWRFLIVEDKPDIREQLIEVLPSCVPDGDEAESEECSNFEEGTRLMVKSRFDMLILDLKDNDAFFEMGEDPPGLKVFRELQKLRFIPVVFYTGWPDYVRGHETSFVRVVVKGEDVTQVREAIRSVFDTNLPKLSRLIDDVEREYLWDFVSKYWKETDSQFEQSDLTHLVARRLSFALSAKLGSFAQVLLRPSSESDDSDEGKAHPMTVYVYPPIDGARRMTGEILFDRRSSPKKYWLLLTPTCDLDPAHPKAEHILLARCEELESQQEYLEWQNDRGKKKDLEKLFKNNRDRERQVDIGAGQIRNFKGQRERFRFLPGTFFLPDLVVDFQQLKTVTFAQLSSDYGIAASLDSPYAESISASFSNFFGRVGTPVLDTDLVFGRAEARERERETRTASDGRT